MEIELLPKKKFPHKTYLSLLSSTCFLSFITICMIIAIVVNLRNVVADGMEELADFALLKPKVEQALELVEKLCKKYDC